MKKILIASLSAVLAGPVFAAGGNFTAGGTTGAATTVTTNCALLSTDGARVNLSAANLGSYDCNTGTASIGVSIANTSGKFYIYSMSSAGGAVVTTTSAQAPTTTQTESQAVLRSASS